MSRILWHSVAPWGQTGYGQQTAVFTPRFRDAGHQVGISAIWGLNGSMQMWNDMPVYPSDENWGNLLLPDYAKHFNADLVVTLMDVWVLNPRRLADLPLVCWVPVDHQPCPPKVARFLRDSGCLPVAMSKFGQGMLADAGLDAAYVPHGIDTTIYKPSGDRAAIRERFGMDDSFIVGVVAHNAGGVSPASGPPRKAFPESIIAFSQFVRDHPDAKLYLHTEMTGRQYPGNVKPGLDLGKLLDDFKVPTDSVMLSNQVQMELGVSQEAMAQIYNSFDVLLNPSYGEGFGIPIVEAQACGTPVIVTDWTSMPELVGAGWKIAGDEPWYDAQHESFFMRPRVAEIIGALEAAYDSADRMRDEAREFALQYDANLVMAEHWTPTLERALKPREVKPLGNRQMRRAKKKVAA